MNLQASKPCVWHVIHQHNQLHCRVHLCVFQGRDHFHVTSATRHSHPKLVLKHISCESTIWTLTLHWLAVSVLLDRWLCLDACVHHFLTLVKWVFLFNVSVTPPPPISQDFVKHVTENDLGKCTVVHILPFCPLPPYFHFHHSFYEGSPRSTWPNQEKKTFGKKSLYFST
jgi:hypothetical protein